MLIRDDAFYESLSPNVRRLVRLLHKWGYETTDSGDGTNLVQGMGCAVAFPMVVIELLQTDDIEYVADQLWNALKKGSNIPMGDKNDKGDVRTLEASYSPLDGKRLILLMHVTDDDIPPTGR